MLKRRREQSPGASGSSSDAYLDPFSNNLYATGSPLASEDPDERAIAPFPRAKRRRTAAPVLDGSQRGWNPQPVAPPEDDGEEDWVDDAENHSHDQATRNDAADYHSVNSLLHDLHQHRRPAPSQSVQPPQPRWSIPPGYVPAAPVAPKTASLAAAHYRPRTPEPATAAFKLGPVATSSVPERDLTAEMECVRNRYEETNRLLRELALSRRRGGE
ncbi:hypothetical protein EXIGLDRAFT_760165 [Exidia glandulosa HHB12029]|uniref:Uncharacterized protein n=1 Tax=Exidia glandulosa HHB12029 TaxID=1314781 RepID=A0A165PBD2_EXIGL|nr:hypothetical protein EXIGLDRAFT_760165 [Exidia glandulosa HHB12029]